jgi:hypothetical protein
VDDRAYSYDVAVSFAGEQRDYVERFVRECESLGLKVFYDLDMTIDLWGRNFIFEFRKMYGGPEPRFVVPFISSEYLAKPYPMDEFAAAVEQSFQRPDVYVLPVRFGDVDIPRELLNPAVGYLQADEYEPAQLAAQMAVKIGKVRAAAVAPLRSPQLAPTSFDARATLESTISTVGARFRRSAASALEPYGYTCRITQDDSGVDLQVERAGRPVCGMSLWFDVSASSRDPNRLAMKFGWPTTDRHGTNGWVSARWNPGDRSAALSFVDFSAGADEQILTIDQFVEALWEKIAHFIEQRRAG